MRQIVGPTRPVIASHAIRSSLARWNRRLQVAAAVVILGGATILALQAAGPDVRAMIAGEGTMAGVSE